MSDNRNKWKKSLAPAITAVSLLLPGAQAGAHQPEDLFDGIPVKSRQEMVLHIAGKMADCNNGWVRQKCVTATFEDGRTENLPLGIKGYEHKEGQPATVLVEQIIIDTSKPELVPMDYQTTQYLLIRVY
jgi:hypothetical protein